MHWLGEYMEQIVGRGVQSLPEDFNGEVTLMHFYFWCCLEVPAEIGAALRSVQHIKEAVSTPKSSQRWAGREAKRLNQFIPQGHGLAKHRTEISRRSFHALLSSRETCWLVAELLICNWMSVC